MADFAIDTSGAVRISDGNGRYDATYRWSDLDPFTQGYIEAAMLAIQWPDPSEGYGPSSSVVRFDWLAPATLAAILADCAAFRARYKRSDTGAHGAQFWRDRQRGYYGVAGNRGRPAFPPQTISLADDGKIHLTGAA